MEMEEYYRRNFIGRSFMFKGIKRQVFAVLIRYSAIRKDFPYPAYFLYKDPTKRVGHYTFLVNQIPAIACLQSVPAAETLQLEDLCLGEMYVNGPVEFLDDQPVVSQSQDKYSFGPNGETKGYMAGHSGLMFL